jgi:hypothetical protein
MEDPTNAEQMKDEDCDAAILRLLLTAADLRDVTERMRVRLSKKIQRKLEDGHFASGHRKQADPRLNASESAES